MKFSLVLTWSLAAGVASAQLMTLATSAPAIASSDLAVKVELLEGGAKRRDDSSTEESTSSASKTTSSKASSSTRSTTSHTTSTTSKSSTSSTKTTSTNSKSETSSTTSESSSGSTDSTDGGSTGEVTPTTDSGSTSTATSTADSSTTDSGTSTPAGATSASTSPAAATTTAASGTGGVSGGAAAGIAIGCLAVVGAMAAGAFFCWRRRQQNGFDGGAVQAEFPPPMTDARSAPAHDDGGGGSGGPNGLDGGGYRGSNIRPSNDLTAAMAGSGLGLGLGRRPVPGQIGPQSMGGYSPGEYSAVSSVSPTYAADSEMYPIVGRRQPSQQLQPQYARGQQGQRYLSSNQRGNHVGSVGSMGSITGADLAAAVSGSGTGTSSGTPASGGAYTAYRPQSTLNPRRNNYQYQSQDHKLNARNYDQNSGNDSDSLPPPRTPGPEDEDVEMVQTQTVHMQPVQMRHGSRGNVGGTLPGFMIPGGAHGAYRHSSYGTVSSGSNGSGMGTIPTQPVQDPHEAPAIEVQAASPRESRAPVQGLALPSELAGDQDREASTAKRAELP